MTNGGFRPDAPRLRLGLVEVLLVRLDLERENALLELLLLSHRLWQLAAVLHMPLARAPRSPRTLDTYVLPPLIDLPDENHDKGNMAMICLVHCSQVQTARPLQQCGERAGDAQ